MEGESDGCSFGSFSLKTVAVEHSNVSTRQEMSHTSVRFGLNRMGCESCFQRPDLLACSGGKKNLICAYGGPEGTRAEFC